MPLQGHDDRRRGDRLPINPEFAALDPGSLTYASNLSEYGVFLNTRVRLPVGTPVELRFTVLLDDPVVISGIGRVVHHQDDPRGMGVVFGGLSAEMHLRVIDAINWYRARALSGADRVFRTRELTPDELEQIEDDADASDSITSLSVRDVVSESGSYNSLSAGSVEAVDPRELEPSGLRPHPTGRRPSDSHPGATASPPGRPAPPAPARTAAAEPPRQAPPPPQPKQDEYEDF
jgi:hypothetical protein